MRFCYNDYVADDTYTLSAADYTSGYPVDNLRDSRLSKYYRSATLTNFITNSDCEQVVSPTLDISTTGLSNGTWARSNTQAQAGTYSWVLAKSSAIGAGEAYVYLTDNTNTDDMHGLTAGYTYRTKVYMFTDCATPGNAKYIVQEYYSALWHDVCTLAPSGASAWELEAGSFTLNSATTGVTIKVSIDTSEAQNKVLYLDEIKFFLENRIVLDAGSGNTLTPTIVALLGHNLSSNAIICIQGNATNSWTNPTVNETLTYASGVILKFPTSQALRYWSISIDDFDNNDEYIKIGRVFIGTYIDVNYACQINIPINPIENSKKIQTPTGQTYGTNLGTQLLSYDLNFGWWNQTMLDTFLTMYNEVRNYKPWIMVIEESDLVSFGPIYCTLQSYGYNHIFSHNYAAKLQVIEEK